MMKAGCSSTTTSPVSSIAPLNEAANYSLDLRLEHQRGAASVTLIGQLSDRSKPESPLANLPVFLVCGKEIVARAFSNTFGEFQVEYQSKRRLRLYLHANNDLQNRIEVPAGRFDSQAAGRRRPRRRSDSKQDFISKRNRRDQWGPASAGAPTVFIL